MTRIRRKRTTYTAAMAKAVTVGTDTAETVRMVDGTPHRFIGPHDVGPVAITTTTGPTS